MAHLPMKLNEHNKNKRPILFKESVFYFLTTSVQESLSDYIN